MEHPVYVQDAPEKDRQGQSESIPLLKTRFNSMRTHVTPAPPVTNTFPGFDDFREAIRSEEVGLKTLAPLDPSLHALYNT